ncbi:g1399 [Coccomyxa elongata]
MRSRGTENGKQTGEVVDSHASKGSAASAVEPPAAESYLTVKRGPQKVLKENNAEVKLASPTVNKEPARKITRQRKPTSVKRIEPVEEAEVPEVDDLQNAASIPLPEDDTAAVPALDIIQKSPKRSRVKALAQPERQHRSLRSWKWVLFLLAVVAGSTLAMSYRHAWQPPLQKGLRQMEGHFLSQARDVEAYLRGPLLLKAKTWQGILQSQVHSQRNYLAELWLRFRYGLQNLWRQALQVIKPEKEMEEVKGCAAQLDAGALVAMVSHKPAYEGLRASLQDIWLGHKEDPHKGAGVLLVGSSAAANAAAAVALEKALPSSCRSCLLSFKAGQASHGHADAPGAVQKELAGFLQRCPQGVVILQDVHQLHPRLLPVFINALSEHGHFEVDGKAVPSWGALYVATLLDTGDALSQPSEDAFKTEAKKALTAQLMAHPSAEQIPGYKAHTDAFRRRLEHVAPLQQ